MDNSACPSRCAGGACQTHSVNRGPARRHAEAQLARCRNGGAVEPIHLASQHPQAVKGLLIFEPLLMASRRYSQHPDFRDLAWHRRSVVGDTNPLPAGLNLCQ